ncbi:hypothetical protein ACUH9Y_08975 [Dermabacteraceae bacterium P13115]
MGRNRTEISEQPTNLIESEETIAFFLPECTVEEEAAELPVTAEA